MTITAVQDPPAYTIFYGEGSNKTEIGRVTREGTAYIFTPTTASMPVAVVKALGEWLEARNAP